MAEGDPVVHLSPNGGMSSMCGVRSSFCWISGVEKAVATGAACPDCLRALRPPPMLVVVLIVPVPVYVQAPPAPPERKNVIDVKEV